MISDIITNVFLNKIFIIVIDIIALFLAFIVFRDNPKAKLNRIYLLMTFSMMGWVNFAYIPRVIDQKYYNLGLISLKIAWFVTPLFFMFLYLLSVNLAEKSNKYKFATWFVVVMGIFLAFFTGLTNLVISGFEVVSGVTTIIYGDYKIPFLIGITFIIIAILAPLFDRKSILHDRKMQYFSLGLFIFLFLNGVFNITLPMFFGISRLYFLGDYSTLVLLAFIAYAITNHQLFNTKVVVAEMISFFIWTAISVQFLLANSLNERLLSGGLLIFVIIFGVFLIRSVEKEIKQKEQIEKLAKEIERAYEVEKKAKEDVSRAFEVEKRANEELQKLDKVKNDFLLTTQHDLRRPLTSVKWFLDMMMQGILGKQTKKTLEGARKVQISVEDSIEEVNDFLDMAQFQMGKGGVVTKPGVDLLAILDRIITKLKPKADESGVTLTFEKPFDAQGKQKPFVLDADPVKIKAAISNVVDNSVKYAPKGIVTVTVSDGKTPNTILITVKDNGIGIPKEKIKSIFESMFERTEDAKRTTTMGKGIGLPLSTQIIKSHNGKIWAESEGEGKGSTFFIELPTSQPTTSAPTPAKPTEIKK